MLDEEVATLEIMFIQVAAFSDEEIDQTSARWRNVLVGKFLAMVSL